MRYLGLDLGTKSLGIAVSDKTRTIASMLKVLHFKSEDYATAINEVKQIVENYDIKKIALGLPKNMNNSEGFASIRSLNFKKMLEDNIDIPIVLIDERLTTMEAENILLDANMSRSKRKKVIDGVSAQIILETLLRKEEKNE